jgi:hypothetical protein
MFSPLSACRPVFACLKFVYRGMFTCVGLVAPWRYAPFARFLNGKLAGVGDVMETCS